MKRQGFTLIELLTVIAIIALLVGILVPVLGSARDSARALLCATNLRSLQTAMTQFSADNSSRYGGGLAKEWVTDTYWGVWWIEPPRGQPGDAGYDAGYDYGLANIAGRDNLGDPNYVPPGDIWGYIQEPDVYLCPIFERMCTGPPSGAEWAPPAVDYGDDYNRTFEVGDDSHNFDMPEPFMVSRCKPVRSYALNERLAPYDYLDSDNIARRKTDYTVFGDPNAIWLTEVHPWRTAWVNSVTNQVGTLPYGFSRGHFGQAETPGQLHNGKANCSFGDGHVERLSPTEINANVTPPQP